MRSLRTFTFALACWTALTAAPALSQAQKPTFPAGSTMERLAKSGKIRVGTKFDQPLLSQKNLSGRLEGFDIEVAKMIVEGLGLKPENIEWVETVSTNREPFLTQGKVDLIIASYAINEKRRQVITFAGPYIVGHEDIMVRKGNPLGIKGPGDLAGRQACSITGSEGIRAIVSHTKANAVGFDVLSKCAEALKNGTVDAIVVTDTHLAGYASKDPNSFDILNTPFTDEPWGVGIQKGDVAFCKFIESVLIRAAEAGRYQKAFSESLGAILRRKPDLPKFDPCA